jgi:hypothetical protein
MPLLRRNYLVTLLPIAPVTLTTSLEFHQLGQPTCSTERAVGVVLVFKPPIFKKSVDELVLSHGEQIRQCQRALRAITP